LEKKVVVGLLGGTRAAVGGASAIGRRALVGILLTSVVMPAALLASAGGRGSVRQCHAGNSRREKHCEAKRDHFFHFHLSYLFWNLRVTLISWNIDAGVPKKCRRFRKIKTGIFGLLYLLLDRGFLK
jgi:hypothetical protein